MKGSSGQREQEVEPLRHRNQQLQARVAELEAENARLLAELAAARKHSGNSSKPLPATSSSLHPRSAAV